ncbi:MAG: glycosyltransferase family 2 protein [Acidobacteria bacterium]|nr:glycosyltransferase family 2 protein [Acidobacteriota bacterium]
MRLLFIAAAAVAAYTYIGYPLLLWLRGRFAPRPWQRADIFPSVTAIMAVHNGAEQVAGKIEYLLALDYPPEKLNLIVVSDGSTDGTDDVLQRISNPRVQSFHYAPQRGKAAALNLGMRHATGDVLLFVDVRPWPEPASLRRLVANLADPGVGCVAGELVLRNEDHAANAAAVGGLYWRHEQWLRRREALVDSPCGVYGGFYAVRRRLAVELPEGTILDDMYQPLAIIRKGYRSVFDESARVLDVWPRTSRGEFNRKVRTLAGNFQLLQLAPWLLKRENRVRFQLLSHKLLRLLVPALLLLMLVASGALWRDPWFAAAFFAQAGFYGLAALGMVWQGNPLRKLTGAAAAFVMLNAAALVGFIKFVTFRGPLWQIWRATPPTSSPGQSPGRMLKNPVP